MIKVKGISYNIGVYSYANNRIRLRYETKKECHDITTDLKDTYLDDGKIFIDPFIKTNGVLKELRKNRIIKDICGVVSKNNVDIPVATLNMGILRQYDNIGVSKYLKKVIKF